MSPRLPFFHTGVPVGMHSPSGVRQALVAPNTLMPLQQQRNGA